MATFIKSKDDRLINLYYVQNIVINPENDKEIIIYNKNGESIIESYDTAEEASTAHDNYVTKMEESSGGGSSYPPDWSEIGYENTPQVIIDGFSYAKVIQENWDSSITNMYDKYADDKRLYFFPLVDTSNVTNMTNAFDSCNLIELASINTSNVINMNNMFYNSQSLCYVPLLDTGNVTKMSNMFYDCHSLKSVPLFDTRNVTNMSSMFNNCFSLTSIPLFNTSNATDMSNMFNGCSKLINVPVFNTSKAKKLPTFYSCYSLSDESLNNIMQMCINATSYTGAKTLNAIYIRGNDATRCHSLSNYQAFLDAGWTDQ